MKVLVVGNSVALYVRPRGGRAYPRLLRDRLSSGGGPAEVEVRASNSTMASDLVGGFEDELLSAFPDVVVFNLGIVESIPRVCPQQWRRRFVRGATRWQRLWLAAEAQVRRPLVSVLGGAPALSVAAFEDALARLVRVAGEEAGAVSICLGLPAAAARIEQEVPGSAAHLIAFDAAIRRVCTAQGAHYLDVGLVAARLGADGAMPDGIHFSAAGHAAVADALAAAIVERTSAASVAPAAPGAAAARSTRAAGPLLRLAAVIPAALLAVIAIVWVPLARGWRALTERSS